MKHSLIRILTAALVWCGAIHFSDGQLTNDPSLIQQEVANNIQEQVLATPPDEYVILRVDQLADTLVDIATNEITDDQTKINYCMNGLRVLQYIWNDVLFDPETQTVDLSVFCAAMLGLLPGNYGIDPYPDFLESRSEALEIQTERNLYFDSRIDQAFQDVQVSLSIETLQRTVDLAPIYQVTYGYKDATNAKTTGFAPANSSGAGRCIVLLNIGANRMLEPDFFQIAVTHETWHCYSGMEADTSEQTLLKLAMREGVATHLSSLSSSIWEDGDRKFAVHDLLFWSEEELAAAEERRSEIIEAFGQQRNDASNYQDWVYLNIPLAAVPGAPSRSAYYVGWLAFQAYVDQQTTLPSPEELLDLSNSPEGRELVWQALVDQEFGAGATIGSSSGSSIMGDGKIPLISVSVVVWMIMSC